MSDFYWLTDVQMERLRPFFPKSHGKPRVDDRRVLSGIVFVNRNGLRWRDAPKDYGPHKTLYSRWKRWGEMGVFVRMMEGLSAQGAEPKTVMIDATYLKAHRTASSLRGYEHQTSCRYRYEWPPAQLLHDRRADQRLHR
jgi:transposase